TDWKAGTTDAHLQGFFKVAGASEPTSYTFTITGKQDLMGGIYAVTGANTSAPVSASGGQANTVASPNCTAPSIAPSSERTLLLFGCASSGGVASFTPPTGMIEKWDIATGGTYKMATEGAAMALSTSGATGLKTATISASKVSAAALVAIAPGTSDGGAGSGSATGSTYYVATTGSDANPGTLAAPLRTITKAYSAAMAGDTIVVEPGTYTETTSDWGLHLNRSGTV